VGFCQTDFVRGESHDDDDDDDEDDDDSTVSTVYHAAMPYINPSST
jgi:hypothetical protein